MHRRAALLLATSLLVGTVAGCSNDDSGDDATGTTATTAALGAPGFDSGAARPPIEGCDGTVEAPSTAFVVDACGRVVILRGVNVESASKGSSMDDTQLPATPIDGQRLLRTWGWNTVRFLVFWGAIEPEDGEFDEEYLDAVEDWMNYYASAGVHVVLDLHQDLYGWAVGGNGAPDWAVDTKGLEPGTIEDGQPWYLQGADPAVQAAYQSFWNPEPGARDLKGDYLEAVAHLAERFADHPAVIGYDVMNEPAFANGDLAATLAIQAQAAAGEFQNEVLTEFMQGGIDAVRTADQDAWVMIQPTSLLNAFPYPGDLIAEEISDPRDGPPRISYAGHLYQPQVHDGFGYPEDDPYVSTWQELRAAESEDLDAALWFGEWGGAPDQDRMAEYIDEVTAMADAEMAGWAWWSWDPGGWSPLLEGGESVSPNGLRLLRVQPRAVAGTPTAFSWDPATQVFRMTWDERTEAKGPTELAVPPSAYFEDIEVVLDGELVAEPDWVKMTSILYLEPDRSLSEHEVCVAPTGSGGCDLG
jgi:endoglycosylceramidase